MKTVEKVDWFCPKCNSYVSSESVTHEETHQICNTRVILEPLNQNNMKRKLTENHIAYCEEQFKICNRKSNKLKPYYFKKQIEVAKRKLKPFKSQLHPIELRTINL